MTNKRTISECINVRINVGNYQHIEITKQASEEIEFSNDKERLALEDNLTNDLVDSVIRSMRSIPDSLGKGVEDAQEVEESIKKAIPEWLNNQPPNLADKPKEKSDRVAAEQKDNKDKASEDILDVDEEPVVKNATVEEDVAVDDDLFEEDEESAVSEVSEVADVKEEKSSPSEAVELETVESETTEVKEENVTKEVVAEGTASSDDFDFFDDDDLDLFDE